MSQRVEVKVSLKKEVLDPEARSALQLAQKEFGQELKKIKISKSFLLEFDGIDPAQAREKAEAIARVLLCNPVSHEYEISQGEK